MKKNTAELVFLAKTEVGWQTATFPLSPGSAIRRFQWHAEDQLLGEWGLRDRGLESRPDQNEMNIQSEAKPHGLICPFTMAVIIWEFPRLLLRQDEKAFWQNRKVSPLCFRKSFWRKLAVPHKGTHESHRDGGKAKMRSQEVSTWVRITESNTRRARYQAAGHTEWD